MTISPVRTPWSRRLSGWPTAAELGAVPMVETAQQAGPIDGAFDFSAFLLQAGLIIAVALGLALGAELALGGTGTF